MKKFLEEIKKSEVLLGIIIKAEYEESGISFLTSADNILQVGYMSYSEKKVIQPHIHNK